MANRYPQNCLVVIADGTHAQMYRNAASNGLLDLEKIGEMDPVSLENDGPAGSRPVESSQQETDEATFAKQLAHYLNRAAYDKQFGSLVLVADPQTLGQVRPSLDKAVTELLHSEHAKTLTTASESEIVRSLMG